MKHLAPCFFLVLAVACGPNTGDGYGFNGPDAGITSGDGGTGTGTDPDISTPDGPCTKMDIVFVVDDSGSMAEEQQNLADNFPGFFDVIDNYTVETGEALDYRIAVTTTGRDVNWILKLPPPFDSFNGPQSEKGDNGQLRKADGMSQPWLAKGDANIKQTFSSLAKVGTGGPSFEMPLHAVELAFTERVADGTNANFLRDDALLAVVILSDEDDCSRTDDGFEAESDQCDPNDSKYVSIDHYTSFLDGLTGAPGRWATAVIAGEQSCESEFGSAIKAERLQQFVSKTGDNGVFSSICSGNLAGSLQAALDTFDSACHKFPPVE